MTVINFPAKECPRTNALRDRIISAIEADLELSISETVGVLAMLQHCFLQVHYESDT